MNPVIGVGLMIGGALTFFTVLAWFITKPSKKPDRGVGRIQGKETVGSLPGAEIR